MYSLLYFVIFLGSLVQLFAGLFRLAFVVEIFEVAVFAEALRVVRTIGMLACRGLFRVTLLVVAGVAHEFGPMPLFGVLTGENVQTLHLLFVQVEPPAHLFEVIVLYLADTVFI